MQTRLSYCIEYSSCFMAVSMPLVIHRYCSIMRNVLGNRDRGRMSLYMLQRCYEHPRFKVHGNKLFSVCEQHCPQTARGTARTLGPNEPPLDRAEHLIVTLSISSRARGQGFQFSSHPTWCVNFFIVLLEPCTNAQ